MSDDVQVGQPETPADGPVTVQYPSGHTVEFPTEAHAQEHASSVWDQLKAGWNKVSNWQGLEAPDNPDRQTGAASDKIGGAIWDHVNQWRQDVNSTLEDAGADIGRKPAEALTLARHPLKYGKAMLGNPSDVSQLEEAAKKNYPTLSGAGEAVGGFQASLMTPENVAIMATMPYAKAVPMLNRGLSLAFAAGMSSGVISNAKNIINNWAKLSQQQKTSALTSGALQSMMAGLATIHAFGGEKGATPTALKGESGEATIPATGQVGTAAGAAADTQYFQEAKKENPDASFSDWLRIAQDKKAAAAKIIAAPVRPLMESDKSAGDVPDVNDKGQKLGVKPIAAATGRPVDLPKVGPDYNEKGQILGVPPAVEDIGGKVRAEQPSMPRGERRAVPRTAEEDHLGNAFRQAVKELGPDATNEQIDERMVELGVPRNKTTLDFMGSGIPNVLRESQGDAISRLRNEETGSATIPGTGQQNFDFTGNALPEEEPDAPLWYSHAIDTIDDKVQNNMTPEQVRGVLVNAGVKPDEFFGTGLDEYLKGKTKISKPELQQFMRENQIQLSETNLGGPRDFMRDALKAQHAEAGADSYEKMSDLRGNYWSTSRPDPDVFVKSMPEARAEMLEKLPPEIAEKYEAALQSYNRQIDIGKKLTGYEVTPAEPRPGDNGNAPAQQFKVTKPDGTVMTEGDIRHVNEYLGERFSEQDPERAQYPDWIVGNHWNKEGGLKATDYTEKLLRLPPVRAEADYKAANGARDEFERKMQDKYNNHWNWQSHATDAEQTEFSGLKRAAMIASQNLQKQTYQAPHFGEGAQNLIGHARYGSLPEMTDKKTMILHEAQSDLNTDIRKKGAIGEQEEVEKQIRDLQQKKVGSYAQTRAETDKMTLGGTADVKSPSDQIRAAQATVDGFKDRLKNGEKLTGDEMTAFRSAQAQVRDLQKSGAAPVFTPEDQRQLETLQERKDELNQAKLKGHQPVANKPLVGDWHELIMKRMLREAVDKGYDRMVWPTGEQQADVYGVHHHVKSVTYDPYDNELIMTKHDGRVTEKKVAPTVDAIGEWLGADMAEKLVKNIEEFKENYETDEDPDAKTNEDLWDMMAEPYSVLADDNEPTYEYRVKHDDSTAPDDYYETHREAQRAMERWWEEEHPHHDIDTGEYVEPEEGEERTHPDDEEKGDIEAPTIEEIENEQEPSYSVYRDSEHVDTFDSERQARRAMDEMISEDVDNYDGPRSGEPEKADEKEWPRLEGLDLHSGGKFHKLLYDTMIPSFLKKYGAKWGAKVGMIDVPNGARPKIEYQGKDFTPAEIEKAEPKYYGDEPVQLELSKRMRAGETLKQAAEGLANQRDSNGKLTDHSIVERFLDQLHRQADPEEHEHPPTIFKTTPQSAPMHYIDITPQMKRALSKGKGQRISKRDEKLPFANENQNA